MAITPTINDDLTHTMTQPAESDVDQQVFKRIIITHWCIVSDAPTQEIYEFSWIVYDYEASKILERSTYLIQLLENDLDSLPPQLLKSLKVRDGNILRDCRTLQQVLQHFDSACSILTGSCISCVLNLSVLKDQLFAETFRKSITTPKFLKSVLDLTFLVTHYYPEEFKDLTEESTPLSADSICQRLQTPTQPVVDEAMSLTICFQMSQILKKMHLDEIQLIQQHSTNAITAPSSTALKTQFTPQKSDTQHSETNKYVVRLRGVPWGATEEDLVKFFEPVCTISSYDIFMVTYVNGKASGEVYVNLPTMADRDKCLQELHGRHMGKRWIEVFKASESDIHHLALMKDIETVDRRGALRLRGLPWSTNEYDIVKFFDDAGFHLSINHIILGLSHNYRFNGDAWVLLESPQVAEEAKCALHKKMIGKRYIEVFSATVREVEMIRRGYSPLATMHHPPKSRHSFTERCVPYMLMNASEHIVPPTPSPSFAPIRSTALRTAPSAPNFTYSHTASTLPIVPEDGGPIKLTTNILRLRGLPYHANETHIAEFFQRFGVTQIVPVAGSLDSRPSGEAYVEFISADEALRALKQCNGALIDKRYIELFPATKQEADYVMTASLYKLQ